MRVGFPVVAIKKRHDLLLENDLGTTKMLQKEAKWEFGPLPFPTCSSFWHEGSCNEQGFLWIGNNAVTEDRANLHGDDSKEGARHLAGGFTDRSRDGPRPEGGAL